MIFDPKVALAINVWDDPRGMTRIFQNKSTWDFDYIFIFDGKWSNYPGDAEFPEHEVFNVVDDWAKETDVKLFYSWVEGMKQTQKRDYGFRTMGKVGVDWVLWCDSDEIPTYNKLDFMDEIVNLEVIGLQCFAIYHNYEGMIKRRPRLFKNPESIHMRKNHTEFYSDLREGGDISDDIHQTDYTVESMTLLHEKSLLTRRRIKNTSLYRKDANK